MRACSYDLYNSSADVSYGGDNSLYPWLHKGETGTGPGAGSIVRVQTEDVVGSGGAGRAGGSGSGGGGGGDSGYAAISGSDLSDRLPNMSRCDELDRALIDRVRVAFAKENEVRCVRVSAVLCALLASPFPSCGAC